AGGGGGEGGGAAAAPPGGGGGFPPGAAPPAILVEVVQLAEHDGGGEAAHRDEAADLVIAQHRPTLFELKLQLALARDGGGAQGCFLREQIEIVAGRLRRGREHEWRARRLVGGRRGHRGEQEHEDHPESRTTAAATGPLFGGNRPPLRVILQHG